MTRHRCRRGRCRCCCWTQDTQASSQTRLVYGGSRDNHCRACRDEPRQTVRPRLDKERSGRRRHRSVVVAWCYRRRIRHHLVSSPTAGWTWQTREMSSVERYFSTKTAHNSHCNELRSFTNYCRYPTKCSFCQVFYKLSWAFYWCVHWVGLES